ncbi:MAG: ABC transporter ATP-binding protein [Candidatus Cloacimonetes bacterium]|nr:ABC transporter ATP-binding protein [Candidatus Cloacimonadota bacterium]
MLELKGIFKYYSNKFVKTYVLSDVDFSVNKGEFVTVMGPSGAGKSTLLYILGMLDTFEEGEYYYYENPVHSFKEKQRTNLHKHEIGFVFQQYHLIDELTVYENIEMPLLYQKIKGSERKGMVCDMLDKFNIVGKKNLFPNQLSGGQQQLVGIARAIIAKPSLILADEPTGNLNSEQGKAIMELFKKLNEEGTTIVQVTHSEKKAAYGNRIVNLLDGRVV